jgi:hypothetical protein
MWHRWRLSIPSPRERGEGAGRRMRGNFSLHAYFAAQSFSRVVDIAAWAEKP